jgi:electron transfer flavoprotein beta subunit
VISMGSGISKTLMTKTLAVGADQAIILNRGTSEDTDSYATALTLAMVIRKIGEYDLILTGMQAADTNAGIVGSGIAEILGISSIIGVRKIEVNNRKVKVERIVSDGYDLMESPLPALITVAHELGDLRTTNLKDILAAQRKPITPLTDSALGTQPFPISRIKLIRIFIPQKESRCELISGENEEVKGSNLALRLKEASLLQRSGNN